mgnify:FL=1
MSPLAGTPAPAAALIDVARLVVAYETIRPDPGEPAQRVAFGTSGHRGSPLDGSFNVDHVRAITQAICRYRAAQGIDGPLFLGVDTHALSAPAAATALEVLAAHGVHVMLAADDQPTPTPAISHAIVTHNRGRREHLADGIVMTPSHNPPGDGGFKYNPPHGGAAGGAVTDRIQSAANAALENRLAGLRRMPLAQALLAATTHRHDYLQGYVGDLAQVIDLPVIRGSMLRIGVDPLGGAGVHYWAAIAERHGIDLTVLRTTIDPQFAFMALDWDGHIRMDPSSPYVMQRLIDDRQRFDLTLACDTDHDRHGIVTPGAGLLPANHYLCAAIDHLFTHRPHWGAQVGIGASVVCTQLIGRLAARLGRPLHEMPVGFKWFAAGLGDGTLGFAGEESAGATFLRRDGEPWTTDKDGIVAGLLAAEMTARRGRDPGELYAELTRELGEPVATRLDAPANASQKARLAAGVLSDVKATELAGEPIVQILNRAPANHAPIGGIKVTAAGGWFAARPSGTEALVKIYAESFRGAEHLQRIVLEAQAIVHAVLTPAETGPPPVLAALLRR